MDYDMQRDRARKMPDHKLRLHYHQFAAQGLNFPIYRAFSDEMEERGLMPKAQR
jgi:hypothetical protein